MAVETRAIISLNTCPQGKWLQIYSLPDGILHAQFIRFGISEGERVQCIERLPGGTIVIQRNRQQLAIGHTLARQIFVVIVDVGEV